MTQTILITGASNGIGAEFARQLALKNNRLIITGRNEKRLRELQEELAGKAAQVQSIALDLAQPGLANRLFSFCKGGVDILINNAGAGLYAPHVNLEPQELEKMIALNITSLSELCRLFGGQMKERRSGKILNVASTAAFQPVPTLAAYAASKSFVLNFSEALNRELAPHKVSVSCLCPGHTETGFFDTAGIGAKESGFFSNSIRVSPQKVARHGIKMLQKRRLSSIYGVKNRLLAFSTRFAPRAGVAWLSGMMLGKG